MNDNQELITAMRDCASLLTKLANDESFAMEKTASADVHPASSARTDYMMGVMEGLGLE